MPTSKVVAYALYNLSATDYAYGLKQRDALAPKLSSKELSAAQTLTRELGKPKNILTALDKYSKNPTVKEKAAPMALADPDDEEVASTALYPARPAKRPGVVSAILVA